MYLGFNGPALNGVKLKAVPHHQAKVWIIEPYAQHYKCAHYVLSLCSLLISFNRFRLKGTQFLIEFPEHNLHAGTHAELGVPFFDARNQIWRVFLGESYSQELSRFILKLTSLSSLIRGSLLCLSRFESGWLVIEEVTVRIAE